MLLGVQMPQHSDGEAKKKKKNKDRNAAPRAYFLIRQKNIFLFLL